MTEAEVECIFGLPAGDYSTKLPPGPRKLIQNRHKELAGLHYGIWASDYGIIVVYFDDAKKVDGAVFYPSFVRSDPTMLERIRGWLSAR